MERKIWGVALAALLLSLLAPKCLGQKSTAQVIKQQASYTLSLELEFSKKNRNNLQRAMSILLALGPNGHATGFLVGDGLVMTAYHVVSGELSDSKKIALGFSPKDQLQVKVFVKGCQATVMRVDKEADLALLEICGSRKQVKTPAFQASPSKDERLLLIARPHGDKTVSQGILHGPYNFRGQEFLSARIDGRDGYSGSPIYNQKAELVGVFSGYDWSQKLALISPGIRAQKLLEDHISNAKP
ncbi:MAG: trypsin-like peptidase domain-containing protein [Pyrinomonadaceae bacterium]|nr:trypsin-like peptidase domain-containing protein [Pyrinomonadaceae bacterium]